MSGANNTGALVGWVELGTVQASYSSAAVTGAHVNTGGLLGFNIGLLQSSYSSGTVSGNLGAGGVLGWSNKSSTIVNSYASGTVSGVNHVGGLAGLNYGNVEGSHATGTVTGTSLTSGNIGGLIGYNHGVGKVVRNSYATGAVSGYEVTGGLVANNAAGAVSGAGANGGLIGDNAGGTVNRSFWNSQTSAQAAAFGTDNNNQSSHAKALTTAQMKTQANFTSATANNGNANPAWDFTGTWVMTDGSSYPLLRSLMTRLTVTANNASKTYDGLAFTSASNNGVTYSVTPDASKLQGTLSYGGSAQDAIDAGSYAITPAGLSSTGQQGYLISYASGVLTVGKTDLTLAGTRAYDGTNNAAAAIFTIGPLVGAETLVLSGGGTVASGDVGNGKAVTLGTLALNNGAGGGSGGLAGNYTLNGGTRTAGITPASLSVSGESVNGRVYDGTRLAIVDTSRAVLNGVIGGDQVAW